MPALWLAVIAVTTPISSGPMNEVTFPVSAKSPKYCAMRSFGAIRIRSVRDAACSGPPAAPIKHPSKRYARSAAPENSAPSGAGGATWGFGSLLRLLQVGNLQAYAFLFGLGIVGLIYFTLFR